MAEEKAQREAEARTNQAEGDIRTVQTIQAAQQRLDDGALEETQTNRNEHGSDEVYQLTRVALDARMAYEKARKRVNDTRMMMVEAYEAVRAATKKATVKHLHGPVPSTGSKRPLYGPFRPTTGSKRAKSLCLDAQAGVPI